jgi:hypothetical protein
VSHAEELLHQARSRGAVFHVRSNDVIEWEAPLPLPEELLADLKTHKAEIVILLGQEPDYSATACTCEQPIGGTGSEWCGVCGLLLICPTCSRCRGCKLALRFKYGSTNLHINGS